MPIPCVIHRTWPNDTLPDPFMAAWHFTRRHNPTFRQILHDDQDVSKFVERYYLRHDQLGNRAYVAFHLISPEYGAARADLFRYLMLYERGGVYLDAKSAARNISACIGRDDEFVTSHWRPESVVTLWSSIHLIKPFGEYQQWWMASAPRHPLLLAVIEKVLMNILSYPQTPPAPALSCDSVRRLIGDSLVLYLVPNCKGTDILWTTGPFAFTQAIDRALREKPALSSRSRFMWPDGDGTFIYDYMGRHRLYGGRLYFTRGSHLVRGNRS